MGVFMGAMLRRLAGCLLLSILVAGCGLTPQGDLVRQTVRDRGAEVEDAGVQNTLWFLCKGASIGAIQRFFAGSGERAAAWSTLCREPADLPVLPAEALKRNAPL
jgi:hypothetical protein